MWLKHDIEEVTKRNYVYKYAFFQQYTLFNCTSDCFDVTLAITMDWFHMQPIKPCGHVHSCGSLLHHCTQSTNRSAVWLQFHCCARYFIFLHFFFFILHATNLLQAITNLPSQADLLTGIPLFTVTKATSHRLLCYPAMDEENGIKNIFYILYYLIHSSCNQCICIQVFFVTFWLKKVKAL